MSKINTINCDTESSSNELRNWLSNFNGAKPGPGNVFEIGEGLYVEIEQPEEDDDDVESMKSIFGFEWTQKIYITGATTTTEKPFRRLCELTLSFLERFDGDLWLCGDRDGPILCRLKNEVALNSKLFADRNVSDLASVKTKTWNDVADAVGRFGAS